MTNTLNENLRRGEATIAASIIGAFCECSPSIQAAVREMVKIANSPDSDADERDMAFHVISEALFPGLSAEVAELDEFRGSRPDARQAKEGLDDEASLFSHRVRTLMEEKGITQEQLAMTAGISQPAVSNVLNRMCRPQRRTVSKFAEALGVKAEELWPSE
jgi:lambda repressor-like predicted transcriptional regulator